MDRLQGREAKCYMIISPAVQKMVTVKSKF